MLKMNPDAPQEVQIGNAPQVVKKAYLLARQENRRIPIFIKPIINRDKKRPWRYEGIFDLERLLTDQKLIKETEEKSGRHDQIALLIKFKKVD